MGGFATDLQQKGFRTRPGLPVGSLVPHNVPQIFGFRIWFPQFLSSVSPKHAQKSCQMLQLLAVETVEDHTSPYPDGTTLTSRRSKIQRWSLWSNCWSKYPWGPTNLCLWCGCVITCSGTRSFGQLLVWNCSGNWWWLGPVISGKKPFCLVFLRVLFPCKRLFRIYFFKSRLFWGEGERVDLRFYVHLTFFYQMSHE